MDEFKISLFESEHKTSFPEYETLNQSECQSIATELSNRYKINISNPGVELASKQSFYDKCNALDRFDLINTLTDLGIEPNGKLFINWDRFEKIDVFDIDDVDRYFNNMWFPSSDDIDLFDDGLSWILSVRHDGCISILKDKTTNNSK
jgi:hypothetical protein